MIGRFWNVILAGCVATVLVEFGIAAKIWSDGNGKRWDPYELTAIIYGVDAQTLAELRETIAPVKEYPLEGAEERELAASGAVLDLDLRERSIVTALDDLRAFLIELEDERVRYEKLRSDFEAQLARIQGVAQDADLLRRRSTLESIDPMQAKDQLMAILQRADDSGDLEIRNDVVVLIRTLPIDKRRKILAEFRSDEEQRRLDQVMREIRLGNPGVPLIGKVRERLAEFDPPEPKDST